MKIFLDDLRQVRDKYPLARHRDGWMIARNYDVFVGLVDTFLDEIDEISFDHDLGSQSWCKRRERELTGYDCICYIEEMLESGKMKKVPIMSVHSDNPWGVTRIAAVIMHINRTYT